MNGNFLFFFFLIFSVFLPCREDIRTANIIADDPEGVSCLVIDRESFNQLISGLAEIRTKYVDDGNASRKSVQPHLLFIYFHIHFHSFICLFQKGFTTLLLTSS